MSKTKTKACASRLYTRMLLWRRKVEQILRKYADQDFSLADAISFVWLKEAELSDAFAYDRHFVIAGYNHITQ